MNLYDFQQKGMERMAGKTKVAFYWDMGLGKSYMGVAKAKELNKRITILICQKSKINDWYALFNGEGITTLDLTKKPQYDAFLLIFNERLTRGMRVVGIINYELFWRRKELMTSLKAWQKNHESYLMILDESSEIQNEKTKQCKAIMAMAPENLLLLSGTPVSGKYENLWSQLYMLGMPLNSWQFKQRYVNYEDLYIGRNQVVKVVSKKRPYKRVEELKRMMGGLNCDFLKTTEVLTLPEQRDIIVKCDTPAQFYTFIKDGIVTIDGQMLVGDNTLVKRLRSKEICTVYNKDKYERFDDLIKSTQDRLIVFYQYTKELENLLKIAQKAKKPVSIVNGTTKDLTAYETEDNTVTFVQYQAGAMGLNLQLANKCVFFSLPDSSALYEQARKRIHRIGQKNICTYFIFQCQKSIEETVLHALERQMDYTNDLFIKDIELWKNRRIKRGN